jgi:hypothetical protein
MSDSVTARRVGLNEGVFRAVNESLAGFVGTRGRGRELDLICECAREECEARIRMDREAYERLRSDPLCFAVVDGHEDPDVECVIDRQPAYSVVRKSSGEAVRMARQTDLRAEQDRLGERRRGY